jgi:hypothetical protein
LCRIEKGADLSLYAIHFSLSRNLTASNKRLRRKLRQGILTKQHKLVTCAPRYGIADNAGVLPLRPRRR